MRRGEGMKTGYHAIYEENYYVAIDNAHKNGFEFVQVDLGVPEFYLDELSDKELTDIKRYSHSKDVEITFHAPGDNVSLFCDYPSIRNGILQQFRMILYKANIIGARHMTFHAGHYPEYKKNESLKDDFSDSHSDYYNDVLYYNLKKIIDSCGNVLVCLENCGLNTLKIEVIKRLIRNNCSLFLTIDTAKSYQGDFNIHQEVYDFIAEYKDYVREIHIHDINKTFGKHQIVGNGVVDFSLFKEFLFKDRVYMNFETRPIEAAIISKKKLISMFKYE